MVETVFEVRAEKTQGAGDRRAGHIDQSAVALAAIEIENFRELIEKRHIGLALLDSRRTQGFPLWQADENGFSLPIHAVFVFPSTHPSSQINC